jgi:hypothetical protein
MKVEQQLISQPAQEAVSEKPLRKRGRPRIYTDEERADRSRERHRRYYDNNREKLIEWQIRYNLEHKQEKAEYQKHYDTDDWQALKALLEERRLRREAKKQQATQVSPVQIFPTDAPVGK